MARRLRYLKADPWRYTTISKPTRTLIRTLAIVSCALALAGCSRDTFNAPPTDGAQAAVEPKVQAPAPPSRLSLPPVGSANVTAGPAPSDSLLDWQLVNSVLVLRGVEQTVVGNCFTLRFSKGSLAQSELITIKMYRPDVLDVQFGPHGTKFATPVELSIDFAGTAADPDSRLADASEPVLWYLDESQNRWVEVQGTTDWQRKRFVVHLEHFSRYVLGGKAGWKHAPQHETEE